MKSEFGIFGLGIMGTGLSRNLAMKGVSLSLYNRHLKGQEENVATIAISRYKELNTAKGFDDLRTFVDSLQSPRMILIMVPAGTATQEAIDSLVPFLERGDIIIDGGNSHYEDTGRRMRTLSEKGIRLLGCGISGGAVGALNGASVMAGGSEDAYRQAAVYLKKIAAPNLYGEPCCTLVSPEGAGHFVKTVHNGMEYAEMQLLAEVYAVLRWAVRLTPDHIAEVLSNWKNTEAASYLLDITVNILREKDANGWIIDKILDTAGTKGTGSWAVQAAAGMGIPAMMITSALHARYLSGQRHIRIQLNDVTSVQSRKDASISTTDIFRAYQLARIINHHEGFAIIRAASKNYNWNIDLSALSASWTNGCTIRSAMINHFVTLWTEWNDELILHPFIKGIITSGWSGLRRINQIASSETVFTPCLVAASQYLSGATLRYPAANLVQAQRDYFGLHGFKRTDDDSGAIHHHPWRKD